VNEQASVAKRPQLPLVLPRLGLLPYSRSDLEFFSALRGGQPNGLAAPNIGHLFLLAVIRHAGAIRVDLHVAPRILLVTARPDIALVNGVLPRRVHRRAVVVTHQVGWVCPLTRFGFGDSEPRPKNRKMTGAPSSLPSSLRATFTDSSGSWVHSRSGSPLHSRNSHESGFGTSVPVMLADIPHAFVWREVAGCGGEIAHGHRRCRHSHGAGQRGAGDDTDRESFQGTPPSVAAPSMAKS
jgi:hypothetical protein